MDMIIYGLYDPISKKPVYVGRTNRGMDRPWEHIEEKSHSSKVNSWIKSLKDFGLNPVVVVLDSSDTYRILLKKELFWINSLINDGYVLLNQNLINPIYFLIDSASSNSDDYLNDIRTFVRLKRKQSKLTQLQLAKKAGVGLRFLRELEQGVKSNFNTDSVQKLLKLYGAKITIGK